MGYNVDVQRNKNREFLQSIEMWGFFVFFMNLSN